MHRAMALRLLRHLQPEILLKAHFQDRDPGPVEGWTGRAGQHAVFQGPTSPYSDVQPGSTFSWEY